MHTTQGKGVKAHRIQPVPDGELLNTLALYALNAWLSGKDNRGEPPAILPTNAALCKCVVLLFAAEESDLARVHTALPTLLNPLATHGLIKTLVMPPMQDRLCAMILYSPGYSPTQDARAEQVRGIRAALQHGKTSLRIASSGLCDVFGANGAQEAFRQAQYTLCYRLLTDEGVLLHEALEQKCIYIPFGEDGEIAAFATCLREQRLDEAIRIALAAVDTVAERGGSISSLQDALNRLLAQLNALMGQQVGRLTENAFARYTLSVESCATMTELKARLTEEITQAIRWDDQKGNSRSDSVVVELQAYVRTHAGENIVLKDLAENRYFLNASYLSRLFHTRVGVSFREYLCEVRLNNARELLKGERSISEIGTLCGYGDTSQFIKLFRKTYGVTPHVFRRQSVKGERNGRDMEMIDYLGILKREVVPALGCTEPVAVSLAAAWAADALGEPVRRMHVLASRNILKNAMSVGIPGSDMAGIPIAAALGALVGKPELGMEVLQGVTDEAVRRGRAMIAEGAITVSQKSHCDNVYVEVTIFGDTHEATAIIQRSHAQVTHISRDGQILKQLEMDAPNPSSIVVDLLTVHGIWTFTEAVPLKDILFLKAGVDMNLKAAQIGLHGGYGLSVGHNIAMMSTSSNIMGSDMGTCAVATTAAACDARMAGASVPVMSVAGSGNQGLVAILPVVVFAQKLNVQEEKLLRAIALSELVTVHIKQNIGRLSALCGCGIAAAIGAACGILSLLGGGELQTTYAIQNMVANITGMVCDGAKSGCAVKVATAVSAAVQCAVLAANNVHVPAIDGIIENDVEKTIQNLGAVGRDGMDKTDQLILDLMTAKQH